MNGDTKCRGALTQKTIADIANGNWDTLSNFLFEDHSLPAGL